ncbi:MAG: trk system potassium uptake protein TrkA [Pirellulaceae bacterium]|jgi:trk system potassium uptake protein TrkA
MADRKHFIVLGLGTFGAALSKQLSKNGCHVTGIDETREQVEELKEFLYEPVIGDVSERRTLEPLVVSEANAVFICLGESIEGSLLATLHARELGARKIVVKAITQEHGKILKAMGVDQVIHPEVEIARGLADRATWPNVLEYMPIDPEYSFVEMTSPTSLVGKTLVEAALRRDYGVWVVGVKDALSGKLRLFPDAEFVLSDDQMLVVVGKQDDLNRLREAD